MVKYLTRKNAHALSTCECDNGEKTLSIKVLKDLPGPIDRLRAILFPDRCRLCGKVVKYGVKVCNSCRKEAKVIRGERCLACGNTKKNCKCKGKSNFYNGIAAPFRYEGVVRRGIALWKFKEAERHVHFFADMIVASVKEAFADINFDVITFVPQTQSESEDRMYNQGELLATAVGEKMNIPVIPLLVKIYETERQRDLLHFEKSGNVFGVFECCNKKMTEGKNILLIDDIKTSGHTINECAKMLHLYDAASVYCAVIAVA